MEEQGEYEELTDSEEETEGEDLTDLEEETQTDPEEEMDGEELTDLKEEEETQTDLKEEEETQTDLKEEMQREDLSELEEKECSHSKFDMANMKKSMAEKGKNCVSPDVPWFWENMLFTWREKEIEKGPELYVKIPEFPKSYLTGAADYLEPWMNNDWNKMLPFIKSRACADDFLRFKYSVWRAYAHLLFSSIPETSDLHPFALSERQLLKKHHLIQHMMLCGVKPHVNQTNESAGDTYLLKYRLDESKIAFIPHVGQTNESASDTSSLLNGYPLLGKLRHAFMITYIASERFNSLHRYFAYRKGLAKCDYIKWDSDYKDVIRRLKAKTRWSELPDDGLMIGLNAHLYFLKKLKESEETGSQLSENRLLNWIDKEYADCLIHQHQDRSFTTMSNYWNFANFDYLSRECAVQAKAVALVSHTIMVHLPASKVVMRNKQLEWFAGMKDKAKWASESMKELPRVAEQYGKRVGGGLVRKEYVLVASVVVVAMGMAGVKSKT